VAGDNGRSRDEWLIYRGSGEPHDGMRNLPEPPPWRQLDPGQASANRARTYQIDPDAVDLVTAALRLRKPLLVTGGPGTGKTSLADSIAYELKLGPVLTWPITSRSTLADGLYSYDAIGRLHDADLRPGQNHEHEDIGRYIRLGPLGTALLPRDLPRVLLIDGLDKGDIDLPNDLLSLLEDGGFGVRELERLPDEQAEVEVYTADGGSRSAIHRGRLACRAFPIIVITSTGEREFAPAFYRRCLQLNLKQPGPDKLAAIVAAHMGPEALTRGAALVSEYLRLADQGNVAPDQLLNALFLVFSGEHLPEDIRQKLPEALLRPLSVTGS
jgi:MoxR-like ATPase